jgi:formate--tetrahydrofolate ligase
MNDRALRSIVGSLGGVANGFPREDGFDIVVASEVMAIFCLSTSLEDMRRRLGNIIVGYTRARKPVYAREIEADGAMTVLLKDALAPNLVQTLENNPAFIHGGPFANIAHGCNSVMATKVGLKLANYVITEAGFGADLGAEKFFNIKCRKAGLKPAAAVVVGTVRALKMHGGVAREDLGKENVEAVRRGVVNIERHVTNTQKFGVPVIVALNRFTGDTDAEVDAVREVLAPHGVEAITCTHWADGGAGAEDLARKVKELADSGVADFKPIYGDDLPLFEKIRTIAKTIYHADDATAPAAVKNQLKTWEGMGLGHLPVCIAKTQYSFSTDPNAKGAPTGHELPVREVKLSNGAEFVVAVAGEIMTMPGLPRVPAATKITLNDAGEIEGLF